MLTTLATVLLQIATLSAGAENPETSLRQFQHTAWKLQDGAPSEINVLAQTLDGYLWLGTANGLFRFDGVRFERYQLLHGQTFLEEAITSLLATDDGGLWIGYTYGGTSFLKDGVIQNQAIHLPHGRGTVFSLLLEDDKSLLAATNTGLIRFYAGRWHEMEESKDIGDKGVFMLHRDHAGALWVATDDFIYRRAPGSKCFENTGIKPGSDGLFAEGDDGQVWLMDGDGILRSTDWQPKPKLRPYIVTYSDTPFDLLVDQTNALWVLGAKTGIRRIPHPPKAGQAVPRLNKVEVEHFTTRDGLSSDRAFTAFKDREGNVWIGTPEGLDRFRMNPLEPAPLPSIFGQYALAARPDGSLLIGTERDGVQMLSHGSLRRRTDIKMTSADCIYPAPDGKIWIAGTGELGYLKDDRFFSVPPPSAMTALPRPTQAMTTGPGGDLWIQASDAKAIWRLHDGKWSKVPETGGKNGSAVVLTTDLQGKVWAGYMGDFILLFDHQHVIRIDRNQGLSVGKVTALYESGGAMWIGGERGMNIMKNGSATKVRFSGPLAIEGISGIIRAEDGSMWINASHGVLRVPNEEIEHALRDPSYAVHYRLFNYLDGLAGKAPQLRPLPSIIRGIGNMLWFITTNGAASIDTARIYSNPLPPPVSITGILSDGHSFETNGTAVQPKGTRNIEIDYTALSLSMPERVLFRYRMEGDDKGWQEVGTRRQAFYSHLPPGRYTFRVMACNNDGVWNDTGATLAITLPPTFLQSWYFKAVAAVATLALFWLLSLIRLRQETSRLQTRLYERFAERERIARDLHDTFFQGIQGLLLSFQSASRKLPLNDPTRRELDKTLAQSDGAMQQGRELVLNLRSRSSDVSDLCSLLEAHAMEFARNHSTEFRMTIKGDPTPLIGDICEELSKLGREALCNAYRHAGANVIHVKIDFGATSFELSVADDGAGISNETLAGGKVQNHWGLPGMKERAAKIGASFMIVSNVNSGTNIQVALAANLAYQTTLDKSKLPLMQRLRTRLRA